MTTFNLLPIKYYQEERIAVVYNLDIIINVRHEETVVSRVSETVSCEFIDI